MTWKISLTFIQPTKALRFCKTSLSSCRHGKSDVPNRDDVATNSAQELITGDSAAAMPAGKKCRYLNGRAMANVSASRLAVVACVLSVIYLCLVIAGILFGYFQLRDKVLVPSDTYGHKVCMPCAQVMPNPALGTAGTTDTLLATLEVRGSEEEGEEEECCAETPAQYAALFRLILARQEEARRVVEILRTADTEANGTGRLTHPDNSSSTVVSAHLALKPPVHSTGNVTPHILQWKSAAESPRSHVRPGLTLGNNQTTLYVIRSGLYFIYCQTLYSTDYVSTSKHVVSTYVTRHSLLYPSTSGILLKSRHTRHDTETDRHSSYVGRLATLRKGDQLMVRVSIPALVSHDDSASFFGLFRVGN